MELVEQTVAWVLFAGVLCRGGEVSMRPTFNTPERASQEKQNSANFSFVAPSSEEKKDCKR